MAHHIISWLGSGLYPTDGGTFQQVSRFKAIECQKGASRQQMPLVSMRDIAAVTIEENAIVMAANIRNPLSAFGIFKAAREVDSFVILELAKSEATYTGVKLQESPLVCHAVLKPSWRRGGLCTSHGSLCHLSLLLRFFDPDSGDILIDGNPVKDFTLKSFRRNIGVVFQHPFLYHCSVAENILLGFHEASMDEVSLQYCP